MTEIRFGRRASKDLEEIDAYLTAEAGPRRAKTVLARVRARIELLRSFPRAAPAIPDDPGARRLLNARPYIVIYSVRAPDAGREFVLVLRIVHGARDLQSILTGE